MLCSACFLICSPLQAADDCPALLNDVEARKLGEVRLKALRGWDKLLTWALTPKNRPFFLKTPLIQHNFKMDSSPILDFDLRFSYFSIYRPLVGIVTKDEIDVKVVSCLLQTIHEEIPPGLQRRFSTEEVLAKVLAYRQLKRGMEISFDWEGELVTYTVDEVLDLWRSMPAFGLIPKKKSLPAILLFRGTDLSFTTEKGWASILSDLDVSGPGLSTFKKARPTIEAWLKKVQINGTPARLIGYSLGGALSLYTLAYMPELLSSVPSSIFGPPGLPKDIYDHLPKFPSPHLYLDRGDVVSQIGYFIGEAWEVSLPREMQVIEAHVNLMSAQPQFSLSVVDLEKENALRR